jgi:hypothetical protein
VRFLVDDDTNQLELRIGDLFQQAVVEPFLHLRVGKQTERASSIDDVGSVQYHGPIGARSEDPPLEGFKRIVKDCVIVRLLEPHPKQRQVPMGYMIEHSIRMVARFIDVEPIT